MFAGTIRCWARSRGRNKGFRASDRDPRFWRDLFRGSDRGPGNAAIEHASRGDGIARQWQLYRKRRGRQWQHVPAQLAGFFLLIWLMGCSHPQPTDWNAVSADVRQKFQQGNIQSALEELDLGLKATENTDPNWNYNLRILKAEIFFSQHKNEESLSLLAPPAPSAVPSDEFSIRRKTIQGAALCSLGRLDQAKIALQEAEALAMAKEPKLLGEVKVNQGTLAIRQNDDQAAGRYFHQALSLSLQHQQAYIEAEARGSLGFLATRLAHYAEAVDWSRETLRLADSLHALSLQAAALSNLGWGYVEMGDYDEAISYFNKAEGL